MQIPFRQSITESKLIICFLSQTTFTEILYNNSVFNYDRNIKLGRKNL